ncbi:Sulfotransferase [Heracleum sosnowskyi]|uniref:Sulfotransferase n=1 Tax=Heracleum sosnowskyi TaxID=360622 RepID=A0AAD8HYB3_9APIA|nr:Sulfotransferase [Heracleum sosnowskyi]
MAFTQLIEEDDHQELSQESKEFLLTLPRNKGWRTRNLYLFQGFWCQAKEIHAILSFQQHFQAQAKDIIVASIPKTGTTWLKALTFSIVNRHLFTLQKEHPLLTSNPHDLVPFLEYNLYANNNIPGPSRPRLMATHVPFHALPDSIKMESNTSRVVYISRNPFDTFLSIWHFMSKIRPDELGPFSFEEAFDMYCNGVVGYGPYWEHMLGYYKESMKNPEKVLFLKYEELKDNIEFHLKRLAEFLGCPFSAEEEREGVIEDVAKLCSFENLKELDVNKNGKCIANFENKHLFRTAKVGDWMNHFTPLMVEQLSTIMEQKLEGSGLAFKI